MSVCQRLGESIEIAASQQDDWSQIASSAFGLTGTVPMLRLLIAAVALFTDALQAADSQEAGRLNILWIIADDLSPELGCYGYEGVSTPNIDRLAAEGNRYELAFSTSPVCSASRTAFITGRYQNEVGGQHHRTWNMQPLPEGVRPVTEILREAGYFVTNGSGNGLDQSLRRGKVDYNFVHDAKTVFDGTDWRQRRADQPFFSQIQIKEPHREFVMANKERPGVKIPAFYPDHPVTRVDWGNYLASIEKLDQRVGEVVARLKADGLYDSTAIIFFGDHGRPHLRGKQWLYDGGIHVPLIIRVPGQTPAVFDGQVSLLDLVPTTLSMAKVKRPDDLRGVDLLDETFHGHPAIFAARDRCGDARDRIRCVRTPQWKYIVNMIPVGMSQRPRYAQMSGYKKLQYPVLTLMAVMHQQGRLRGAQAEWFAETRPPEELYDLVNDPNELHNLAEDPAHRDELLAMRSQLMDWQSHITDYADVPEGDAEFLDTNMAAKREYYEKVMTRRKLDPNISDAAYLRWWKGQLDISQ